MADSENSGGKKGFKNKTLIIGVSCLVMLCLLFSAFFVLKRLLKDDGKRRKRQIQRVTLVKPQPPPKIKEKPPEPEIEKKEEIVEPEPEEAPPEDDHTSDEPPPGEDLGLDADGSGGGDGFGLKAKKGGRSLIGGGGGGKKSLMRRYAWYTRILQDEIREKVNKYLEDVERLPGGKHRIMLKLKLDDGGGMLTWAIYKSSGDTLVDEAVRKAMAGFRVSEAPPGDMPRTLKIKVTFKS
ncbi:MAG: energy transducer TonB [Desulfobacter sp.]|nr:MAG: energy transducer TonB [Desulfobacter sp.]